MHVRDLDEAPLAGDFLAQLREEESERQSYVVSTGDVALGENGVLTVGGQRFRPGPRTLQDLAGLARIPADYFADLEPDLRAVNFNRRLPRTAGGREVTIVSNGNTVERICLDRLLQPSRAQVVAAILEAAPANVVPNNIRCVGYGLDGHLDVSFISRALQTQPRVDDTVCGGVHLTIKGVGAVQVGPATFRLVCSNGALARVCAGGRHRVRRGAVTTSDRTFIGAVQAFARAAWDAWDRVVDGLRRLSAEPLAPDAVAELVGRLRQSPFFISARAARLVQESLTRQGTDGLTLYDLHNAITAVGTHALDVLDRYRYRLRLGAGALAHGRTHVCPECRRLVIA